MQNSLITIELPPLERAWEGLVVGMETSASSCFCSGR